MRGIVQDGARVHVGKKNRREESHMGQIILLCKFALDLTVLAFHLRPTSGQMHIIGGKLRVGPSQCRAPSRSPSLSDGLMEMHHTLPYFH